MRRDILVFSMGRKFVSAIGATAAAAALCAAGAANAAVVTWNCNLLIPGTFDGLWMNVETQRSGGFWDKPAGWDLHLYGEPGLQFENWVMRYPGATSGLGANLAEGTSVGAAGSFTFNTTPVVFGSAAGQWKLNAINYFGFRFAGADGQTRYGYGVLQVGAHATTRTLLSVSYESTAGAAIVVPAPSAIALLGAAGLMGRRRRN